VTTQLTRRRVLHGLGAAAFLPLLGRVHALPVARFGPPEPFDFPLLRERAAALARTDFVPAQIPCPTLLERIDYDTYQAIRFRSRFGPGGWCGR
jgi:glucans biosynthesis protein